MSENLKTPVYFEDKNPYNLKKNPYNPYNFRVTKKNPYNPYILATLQLEPDPRHG